MTRNKRDIYSAKEHDFQVSNRYRVPTRSGIELGATITRPTSEGRFPALVWYDPYRRGADGIADPMARYFARRGYAFVNLNVRGTGNSQGVSTDEYTREETQDGHDAIGWLAGQPLVKRKGGYAGGLLQRL